MSDSEQPTRIDSPLPARIGDYDVRRKLGAGGMGTVYLGQHRSSGELAAIKVLSASLAREPGVVDRFQREIEVVGKLKSRHIVSLLGSGEDSETGQLYFAMDYVEGQTLTELLLAEKRLSWEETVDIALQICTGLKSAHVAGVIHRDLKPSNLLIGSDGLVRLTDFGVAQLFATQRLTVTGGIIGTAEYMSPEQAEGLLTGGSDVRDADRPTSVHRDQRCRHHPQTPDGPLRSPEHVRVSDSEAAGRHRLSVA